LLIKYKNDKPLNENLGHERCECQYYKHMEVWNGQRVRVANQMPTKAREDDEHHDLLVTQ
jgi:hypothetical protein